MFKIKLNEDVFKSIINGLDDEYAEMTLEDFVGIASESNEYHCFEILNMGWNEEDLTLILNDGFDIIEANLQVEDYIDYISGMADTTNMYYNELMRLNDYMGDDATFDYCGSYVEDILSIIYTAMELGYGEEV